MNILDYIRERWFCYRLKRQPVRAVLFPRWSNCHRVLVIYESDLLEKNQPIKQIVSQLQKEGKEVCTWGFLPLKQSRTAILPQSRILSKQDINWLYEPNKEVLQDLLSQRFDLLIDLTQEPCLTLQYLAMYANASFKTGRHIIEGVHDLMVDMPATDNPTPLFQQLLHFLQTIQSND
ncbi:MAG: hypothetical protein IJS00_02305 [Paludibacteraceae bacterium]|nr:hypothetical protein [Paludibacteraceae bacterium]